MSSSERLLIFKASITRLRLCFSEKLLPPQALNIHCYVLLCVFTGGLARATQDWSIFCNLLAGAREH